MRVSCVFMFECVRVCACGCVCVCARAFVFAYVSSFVLACFSVRLFLSVYVCACV